MGARSLGNGSFLVLGESKGFFINFRDAESYDGVEYQDLEDLMCGEEKVPLGKIMLALQTAAISDYTLDDLLFSDEPVKWGKIWQEIGLKGKPDHGTAPGQIKKQDGENTPPDAGTGNGQGSSQGGKQ
jgi:hypothetical protein